MTWLPPPLIGLAAACALLMPVLLVALRGGPLAVRRPAPRIKASIVVAWAAWLVGGMIAAYNGYAVNMADWLAGAAILIAMTLAMHVVWSIVVWGFSLNLLVTLVGSSGRLDSRSWADAYSGGRSDRQICLDRIGVLTMFGVATSNAGGYTLDKFRSNIVLFGYKAARYLYGMST
jgi:hypothetical protein